MDKQGATNHILTRLQAGIGREVIIVELSHTLKAPPAVIVRFVDQVISSHPEASALPPMPMTDDKPEWMETFPIQAETHLTAPVPSLTNTDLPPGLQAIISQNSANVDAFPSEAAMPIPLREPQTSPDMALPRQAVFDAPVEKGEFTNIDLEMLGEFVFQQLKKQRRHNDVVEAVCTQTGWHWNKSQRFVARVQTKRHDQLQSGKNRIIVVIGIGIILAGLIMTLNGASGIAEYAKLAAYAKTNPETLLNISPQGAVYTLASTVTGIGMIIGGGFGIARVLSGR